MRRARLVIALALLAQASCGDDEFCSLIGCADSSASIILRGVPVENVEVRICADGECQMARAGPDEGEVTAGFDHQLPDKARLVVEVRRRGRVISRAAAEVPVTVHRPNGPDCPPVCRHARARLDLAMDRLEPI